MKFCSPIWKIAGFSRKEETSICSTKRKKSSCINGFATSLALICFFLLLQLCALFSLYAMEAAHLQRAASQSAIDLAIFAQAEKIIENNIQARACMTSGEIQSKQVEIGGHTILFKDQKTRLQVQQGNILLYIYYDEDGIISYDYQK